MDHASTTPMAEEVTVAICKAFRDTFGNASSPHSFGRAAKAALEGAREEVASLIGATAEEIYFNSGGTESDNTAIKGVAMTNQNEGRHIITTSIEHPAILEPCRYLERQGFKVTYLPVTSEGIIRIEDLVSAIRKDTTLISIMHANNEIGTIQPIEEVGKIAKEMDIPLHTDAVQTAGKIPVDVNEMKVDLLSISSHKLHGPKGVGALYIRKDIEIEPFMNGGGHEAGLRSGTENVPGIVGLAKAAELTKKEMPHDMIRLAQMRDGIADLSWIG